VLWVGIRGEDALGRLERLAAGFEHAARTAGFAAENRPFRPHLTLARASRTGRAVLPAAREFVSEVALEVDRVKLFRSELLPGGARYSVLETFPFRACRDAAQVKMGM
jgi:2'-5' RNA ligase